MKKNSTGIIVGTSFIVIGVYYIIANFLNIRFDIFFDGWWTLFIIIPSLMNIINKGMKLTNISFLIVGVVLFLYEQRIISGYFSRIIIIALVMITIGVFLILKNINNTKNNNTYNYHEYNHSSGYNQSYEYSQGTQENYNKSNQDSKYDNTPMPVYTAIMSGVDVKNVSNDFAGAKCNAVMGSIELDLRDVNINRDITVDISSFMASVEIKAPMNTRIYLTKNVIAGDVTCRANSLSNDANVPIVHFLCNATMGSIEII